MPSHYDDLGRRVDLPAPPRRLVSLVPSQTELLAALGLDEEVVGLTRFCIHPEGWKARKTIVGGTKQVDVERIAALAPELILANKEENTREMVEALERVAPVWVTDVHDVPGACAMIRSVGALVGRTEAAERVAAETESAFAALAPERRRRALYLIWREPWMSVGRDTIIHDVMERAGLDNVCGDRERYPQLDPSDLRAAAPEVVLLSSEPYPFAEAHVAEVRALVPGAEVRLVDGELFSWYGSRLRLAPPYLRTLTASVV